MNKFVMKGSKDVVGGNSNYQGTRMVFLHKNSTDMLEELRMLTSTTQLSRDSRKCNRSAMTSSQRNDEAKGY